LRFRLALLLSLLLASFSLVAANIPRPAKNLKFRTPVGEIALSQYRGKIVVLEFLLTTCPACKNCSRVMEKLNKEFAAKGVQMLGIAINEGADRLIQQYVNEVGSTYPVGYVDARTALDFLQHPVMLRMSVPQLVFIDRNGMVRAQYPGTDAFFNDEEKNMRQMLQGLLKGTPSQKPSTVKKR